MKCTLKWHQFTHLHAIKVTSLTSLGVLGYCRQCFKSVSTTASWKYEIFLIHISELVRFVNLVIVPIIRPWLSRIYCHVTTYNNVYYWRYPYHPVLTSIPTNTGRNRKYLDQMLCCVEPCWTAANNTHLWAANGEGCPSTHIHTCRMSREVRIVLGPKTPAQPSSLTGEIHQGKVCH